MLNPDESVEHCHAAPDFEPIVFFMGMRVDFGIVALDGESQSHSVTRTLKKLPSFVLGSQASSTYPKGTPPVLASPAALLDDPFEHPIGCDGTHFLISSFLQHLDNRAIGRRKLIVGQIFYRHPSPFFTSQYLRRATTDCAAKEM